MKRFRFRLEGLLRLRKVEEERSLGRLRARQAALADVEARRHELESERGRTVDGLRRLERGHLQMDEILRHRRYLLLIENRTREVAAEAIRRTAELREAQRATERAVRERQLVERLRERRRDEHEVGARREEIRDLDEIGSGAAARREARG
jgi:flagellar FliJ protein